MRSSTESSKARGQTSLLLEREAEFGKLEQCLERVGGSATGMVAFIGGEAGVGKTALVRELCGRRDLVERALYGACEPLLTRRPLGPFIDLAEAVGGELAELVDGGAKAYPVASALLRELAHGRGPTLVVLEDLHWADEATLDVLRLTARRLAGVGSLIVVTYRDDELGAWHPLRVLMGELGASQRILRMSLAALSVGAVRMLAESYSGDIEALYERTGGNPFFVSELLASGEESLPGSVVDAVLARAARLSPLARRVLEAIAIAGPRTELWLLERMVPGAGEQLVECIEHGMIVSIGDAVAFRHELMREAIVSVIGDHHRRELHAAAVSALSEPPHGKPDLARLAHHADSWGELDAVLRFVPHAAEEAAKLGAHREAAALYARALEYAEALSPELRAGLLERRAAECYCFTDFESAEVAQGQALACYRELGAEVRQAAAQSWLSNLVWQAGSLPDAQPMALEAVGRLERLGAGRERVAAYIQVAQLKLAAEEPEEASAWAARAQALADELGRPGLINSVLTTVGWVEFFTGQEAGLDKLERSIEMAEAAGREGAVAAAHMIIGRTAARLRMYDLAERHVRAGLDYCDGRQIDVWRYYLISWQSKLALARGSWGEAARLAEISLGKPCPFSRIHALVALGLVRARRGDPDVWPPLDEALRSALPRREFQWIGPVAAARAEAAWLEGRADAIAAEIEPARGFPMRCSDPYAAAVAHWCWRGGVDFELPPGTADRDDPQLLQIAGDWAGASECWRALGCPYESALALLDSDDPERLREALLELQPLGAQPATAMVSRRLRELGERGIPRGPRPGTRANPAGLTARELDVITLLAEGLRNAEIAQRLIVSEKTVDHHVSAILRKLCVRNRGEAAAEAVRLKLTDPR